MHDYSWREVHSSKTFKWYKAFLLLEFMEQPNGGKVLSWVSGRTFICFEHQISTGATLYPPKRCNETGCSLFIKFGLLPCSGLSSVFLPVVLFWCKTCSSPRWPVNCPASWRFPPPASDAVRRLCTDIDGCNSASLLYSQHRKVPERARQPNTLLFR